VSNDMKRDEIKVIIYGLPKVGKSTVTQIVTEALERAGFPVGHVGASFYDVEHQSKRKQVVKEKAVVLIEERNVRKDGKL